MSVESFLETMNSGELRVISGQHQRLGAAQVPSWVWGEFAQLWKNRNDGEGEMVSGVGSKVLGRGGAVWG